MSHGIFPLRFDNLSLGVLVDLSLQCSFASEIGDAMFNLTCVLPPGENYGGRTSAYGTGGRFRGKKQYVFRPDVFVH